MGPEALAQVLRPLRAMFDPSRYPDLLSGIEAPDDAAVWRIDADRAVVLTADYFPPVVDDPYAFGAVAAANALSDLYAMGADPLLALNLVGFPDDLDPAILSEILRGGGEKVREAGAVVAGGHTTVDREPKYGLAALGIVHPDRILNKGGARAGDALLLTKPIGTGVITTAHKRGEVGATDLDAAVASMSRLSRHASRILRSFAGDVHALTDITGFGLIGHAHEVAHLSGVSLRLEASAVPRLPGAEWYAAAGFIAGGLGRNDRYYGTWVRLVRALEEPERQLLFDPQTSGGLFAAVDPRAVDRVLEAFRAASEPVWRVGEVAPGDAGTIEVA
jgi:selenide,water dikinase